MAATKTRQAWVPETNEQLLAFQRKLTRHLIRRRPGFPRAILDNEIVPDAWAVGYAEYLEMTMDPEIEEIRDPEALLLSICVNEGEHLIRSSVRRDARFQVKATSGTDSSDSDVIADQTIEDLAARDQATIEKHSPLAAAVKNDQRNVMLGAMAELPAGQLDAFRRVILLDQSQVDAARELGVGIRPFEKRLKKAVSQVAWAITQTSDHALCDEFNAIAAAMPDPSNPNRAQQTTILKHIQSCPNCKSAIFESPFGIDGLGLLFATGAFGSSQVPSIGERISSLPIVDVPIDTVRNVWEKVWPGSHGAEAAIGGGTAAGGAGGTALAVGGGKALITLCAGVATTACVAGVATGVIPIAKSNADKDGASAKQATTKTVEPSQVASTDSRAVYEVNRSRIEAKIQKRADRRQARKEARQQKAAQEKLASSGGSTTSSPDQVSYTSPATSTPTTQAETNESAMAASTGIPTSSSTSSSSSSGSSSSGTSSAQTQTNQSSANDSFGFGQ